MDSITYCNMACNNGKNVCIPSSGSCKPLDFKFLVDKDRALFISMIGNTQFKQKAARNHKVAIVGLSPADTQLKRFTEKYNSTGSYSKAASGAAFEGLSKDLIRMMNGLGVCRKLGLEQLQESLDINNSEHFLTTSLIKCASLTVDGSSCDFSPWQYESNIRCISHRFVPEMIENSQIEYILILGSKAKKALISKVKIDGESIHDYLVRHGKKVAYLPHPSGANRESVDLASLSNSEFPSMEAYQTVMWEKYKNKKAQDGKTVGDEARYKMTRCSRWKAINEIRKLFNS